MFLKVITGNGERGTGNRSLGTSRQRKQNGGQRKEKGTRGVVLRLFKSEILLAVPPDDPNVLVRAELGLSRLRWKNRQKVLQKRQKSAQIVLDFYKKCLKLKNNARKFLELSFFFNLIPSRFFYVLLVLSNF